MTILLGIDPGSRHTGYGVIEQVGNRTTVIDFGTISTTGADMAPRLGTIFAGLCEVMSAHRPEEVSIEKVFMARNPDSALKLGQARGADVAGQLGDRERGDDRVAHHLDLGARRAVRQRRGATAFRIGDAGVDSERADHRYTDAAAVLE